MKYETAIFCLITFKTRFPENQSESESKIVRK